MKDKKDVKREIVSLFLKKGVLLSPEIFSSLTKEQIEEVMEKVSKIKTGDLVVLNQEIKKILFDLDKGGISLPGLDQVKTALEKGKNTHQAAKALTSIAEREETEIKKDIKKDVMVINPYYEVPRKRQVQDFVTYFNHRYKAIKKILVGRRELTNVMSINRIRSKKERDHVSMIGILKDKKITKNKNIILVLEDPTGQTKVLINKNRQDLYVVASSLVNDEVIGLNGVNSENIVFADNLFLPDIPANKELKKHPEETYALFLSDMHVGSNNFLREDFEKFLKWINLEIGNDDQKKVASKVKYIFIVGDLVDGCGIYPEQDKELEIKDIYEQYKECAYLLSKIPKNIEIVVCPGNHDAMRIAEPQPKILREFARDLYDLPNITIVSNPAFVNIARSDCFPGFDVLLYHGYSFDYFISEVDSIRNNGGYDRADLMMKFLLQRRHLAPTHTSTLYIPNNETDPLVIDKVPDFFISGHIHKSIAANYRNVTLVCGSCWQAKTAFQEKVGHNPEPSRVPLVNLKTREIKILKFKN